MEDYREVGRVVATLMTDEVFNAVAYRAKNRDHLLAGIDEFMDAVTILPPGEWDPSIRIEPPSKVPSQEPRKNPDKPPEEKEDPALEELRTLESQGLVRTGRFFGGLINDIKRKAPWYGAINFSSLSTLRFNLKLLTLGTNLISRTRLLFKVLPQSLFCTLLPCRRLSPSADYWVTLQKIVWLRSSPCAPDASVECNYNTFTLDFQMFWKEGK